MRRSNKNTPNDKSHQSGNILIGGNILIVDDNAQNLRLLLTILNAEGYKVRPAPSGAIALESAFSKVPDLILLDIMMPEMDGYEVCRRLKENETTREVPIIFLSAMDSISEKLKAFDMGAVDYITKPYQPEEISARVNTHLTLRRTQKLLEYEILMRMVSENTLQLLSRKYDLILTAAGEGILGIDCDCSHTFVNPAAATMLGYDVEELSGKPCISIWYPDKTVKGEEKEAEEKKQPHSNCLDTDCPCTRP
ncbi:MAG: response regulator [Desulfamplus sp.]|nr:response regulator [Desulfamplus sp.]